MREKFSVAYRKNVLEEVMPNWNHYDSLNFLEPFVNLRPEAKKSSQNNEDSATSEKSVQKSPLDETVLIRLVKEKPVLYDKKHEDFRVSTQRKRAWDEIASVANWDVDTLQKRWRVMRDRFVRELRRSKNIDPDSQLNCSAFFREMLFLAHHVRSKKYEVETHFVESDDSRDYEYDDRKEINTKDDDEQLEITTDDHDKDNRVIYKKKGKFYYEKDAHIDQSSADDQENEHYTTYIEDSEELEQNVHYEEANIEEIDENDLHEDEYVEEIFENHEQESAHHHEEEEVLMQENITEQWVKREAVQSPDNVIMIKKRRASNEEIQSQQQQQPKVMRISDSQSIPRNSTANENVIDNDEDIAFGNTIGCMLKKIPQHLKTSVKLKLLQSLAEFEAQHKLS